MRIDAKTLLSLGKVDIYMVVIELTGCQELCEAFLKLGVSHVISFSHPQKVKKVSLVPSSSESSDDKSPVESESTDESNGDKIRRIQGAMKDFCLHLYP